MHTFLTALGAWFFLSIGYYIGLPTETDRLKRRMTAIVGIVFLVLGVTALYFGQRQ